MRQMRTGKNRAVLRILFPGGAYRFVVGHRFLVIKKIEQLFVIVTVLEQAFTRPAGDRVAFLRFGQIAAGRMDNGLLYATPIWQVRFPRFGRHVSFLDDLVRRHTANAADVKIHQFFLVRASLYLGFIDRKGHKIRRQPVVYRLDPFCWRHVVPSFAGRFKAGNLFKRLVERCDPDRLRPTIHGTD